MEDNNKENDRSDSFSDDYDYTAIKCEELKKINLELAPKMPPDYKVTTMVGEGAMGVVYVAANRRSGMYLAVKVVETIDREFILDVLKREFEIQKNLKHPNVAIAHGITSTASYAFIFMELLTGGDLYESIPLEKGLSIYFAFHFYKQILDGIEYIHSCQIVHLDIKPENIMITNNKVPKLVDFGNAVCHRNTPSLTGHVGTVGYSAPETFLPNKTYTGYKADLFSFHVTFMATITGQRCWDHAKLDDSRYDDWHSKTLSSKFFKRFPVELITFLSGALEHDPEERFSIQQIRDHVWFKDAIVGKLNTLKPCEPLSSVNYISSSQPTNTNRRLKRTFAELEMDDKMSFSQPIAIGELLMPNVIGEKFPENIVKSMTRFFSTENSYGTFLGIGKIIDILPHCSVIHKSTNHIMVKANIGIFNIVFRVLICKFAGSTFVDFRRVKGDGYTFHFVFKQIIELAREFNLVDDKNPNLSEVQPS